MDYSSLVTKAWFLERKLLWQNPIVQVKRDIVSLVIYGIIVAIALADGLPLALSVNSDSLIHSWTSHDDSRDRLQ